MDDISVGLIVVIIVIGLAELALVIWALVDIIRRPTTSALPRWAWAIVVIFFNLLGPILYIAIGRRSDTTVDRYANDPIVPPEYLRPQPYDGQAAPGTVQTAAPAPGPLQSQTPAAPLESHMSASPTASPDAADGAAVIPAGAGAAAGDAGSAGGGEAAPPAPEAPPAPAPDAPDAPESGQSRAERAIDTLYWQEKPRQ